MQKIIAFILSIVTLISTLIPGLSGNQVQGVTTGDWLTMLDDQFGMSNNAVNPEPYYANIGTDNQYFAAVQIAYDWGVINSTDVIDVDKDVTTEFVAKTLVNVANLQANTPVTVANSKQLKYPAQVATAASLGLVDLTSTGRFKVVVMAIDAAKAALAKAYELWQNKKFGAPAIVESSKDVVNFSGDFEPALPAAEITAGDGAVLQAPYVPLDNPSGISQSQIDIASLLKKLDVSFSIKGFNFGLKVTETGFNLDVGATICNGVKIQKSYDVSNLNVSTKFDGNLVTKDIKEAYIRADYDLKDVTTLTGSYATSLGVDNSKLPADAASTVDFMTALKDKALALMPGGGNKVTVFTFQVPIPDLPGATISLDVNLRITVDGKIQITIESSQVKGVEIVNNKIRIINEAIYKEQTYDVQADVRFTVGLCFSIKWLGQIIVDAEFEAGVGVKATAYIQTNSDVLMLDTPLDLAIQVPYPALNGAEFCGNVKIYGLMSVSVGQNSPILKLLGLTKTWVIFDENNAVLYNLHLENDADRKSVV